MTIILEIKEKIKKIYAEYGYAISLVLKFALAYTVFTSINKVMGYTEALTSVFPVLLFSLIASLISVKTTAIFAAVMILGHAYGLGWEALGLTFIVLILLLLFFLRFDEKDSVALMAAPIALALGIPCFIPICFGLKGKPSSAVSIGCGTFMFYYLHMLNDKAQVLVHVEDADLLTNIQVLVDGVLQSKLMFVNIAAMVLVVLAVYFISRISLDHIWHIAIGTGAIFYVAVMLCGGLFFDIETSVLSVVFGTLVSVVLAVIMEFFVLNVDYSRTERIEFEDDEYYYYVKAIPKISITTAQREIKTIDSEDDDQQARISPEQQMEENVPDVTEGMAMKPEGELPDFESKLEESLNDL